MYIWLTIPTGISCSQRKQLISREAYPLSCAWNVEYFSIPFKNLIFFKGTEAQYFPQSNFKNFEP
jgi:hypothetical protein